MSYTFHITTTLAATPIYIATDGNDAKGLQLVASSFARDVELVSGKRPNIINDLSIASDEVIIAGTVGQNSLIDQLIAEGKLTAPSHNRECYVIEVLEQPLAHIKRALVIAGSDKRGTFYGIYHISKLIGVSPWVYWGDVTPEKKVEITLSLDQCPIISKQPSITYRGFFLNDEWPSLGTWTTTKFGGFNELMYQPIFELLLRLNGNFMWPAMWSAIFSENGKAHPQAIAELADAYGIVMGTSHHEPMFRAGEEWQQTYHNYADNNIWDFELNREAITRFWEDGVIRNKNYESIVTLGMRGERDSELGGTLEQNVNRLKDIITTQKQLLNKHGLASIPKALVVYKEVEKFWHGSDEVIGLKHWDELKDVIIILSDDNFGNMRTLPEEAARDREAGWGIYYHFDYHGGPVSYEWVNTTPLEKVWEQMTMAHEYGIHDLWVVNVGDLKPNEFPISYFMDLAYRYDELGLSQANLTKNYANKWVQEQFGYAVNEQIVEGITSVLIDYIQLNGQRKPEVTYPNTYSITAFNEAERVLSWALNIERRAEHYRTCLPEALLDAYDQLIYYPAVASANVKKMNIYAAYNEYYRKGDYVSQLANKYAMLVEECIQRDIELDHFYNEVMSSGKWYGMMRSPHVGYVHWNSDGWSYPKAELIPAKQTTAQMLVHAEGQEKAFIDGRTALPVVHQLQAKPLTIVLSNGGLEPYSYEVQSSTPWVKCQPSNGEVAVGSTLTVTVDFTQLAAGESNHAMLTVLGAGQQVEVEICAIACDQLQLPIDAYIAVNGVVAMSASRTQSRAAKAGGRWQELKGYGRFGDAIKYLPSTATFEAIEHAPYIEYSFYVEDAGEYELTVYMAPTNPLYPESRLRYGIAIDDQQPVIIKALSDTFTPGESRDWEQGVLNNGHHKTSKHMITAGAHTLKFYSLDAGIVLQKLVLSNQPLPYSYLGPTMSYYKEN